MSAPDTHRLAAAIWRIESPKLIAVLARLLRSVELAEEIAQDAFVEALESWQRNGLPDNPGGWLMTAARHRALDALRRTRRAERKQDQVELVLDAVQPATFDESLDEVVADDLLRLMFVACHPVLSQESRVALTLRLLGGLTTDEIARAFLVPEPTIAQRVTRAKRTLASKGVPFELPQPADLSARLESVLEVVYLVYNEGYLASEGDDWMRPALCDDALRLGRTLAELVPSEPEVHALVALMELQAARAAARTVKPSCCSSKIAPSGTRCWCAVASRVWRARKRSCGAGPVRICCKPQSPRATRALAKPATPTGRASARSTPP
jgi:RNA polymerase sigma factor (sigma-70 family)